MPPLAPQNYIHLSSSRRLCRGRRRPFQHNIQAVLGPRPGEGHTFSGDIGEAGPAEYVETRSRRRVSSGLLRLKDQQLQRHNIVDEGVNDFLNFAYYVGGSLVLTPLRPKALPLGLRRPFPICKMPVWFLKREPPTSERGLKKGGTMRFAEVSGADNEL